MSILEQIEKDYQEKFKQREELVISTLRMLLAALKNAKIQKKANLEDEEILKIIKIEIKKRKEAISEYEKAGRQELSDKEKQELEILKKYLPEQMSEDEIKEKVKQIIAQIEDKENFGQVMGQVMAELKDQADGTLVKKIVQDQINQ